MRENEVGDPAVGGHVPVHPVLSPAVDLVQQVKVDVDNVETELSHLHAGEEIGLQKLHADGRFEKVGLGDDDTSLGLLRHGHGGVPQNQAVLG